MYTCNCHVFFLRTHLFVLAPLSETLGEVVTIRPSGSCCRRFGRVPCRVSRVASLLSFFYLGHEQGKSPGLRKIPRDGVSASPRDWASASPGDWVYASPRGLGFRIPNPRVRTQDLDANKPGFSATRGYAHISLFLQGAPRYDPAAQQQSSPVAAAACNSMRV